MALVAYSDSEVISKTMELRQLRYFVCVAELQSFTKAATRIHIAQPALSRQVKALEEEVGVELLVRTARGVQLTEAGVRLKQLAESILRQIDDLPGNLKEYSGQPFGSIVVGLPPSIAYLIAANLIDICEKNYPLISLRIIENTSVVLRDWLNEGKIDLAVLTDPGHVTSFERIELLQEDMVLIGAPQLFEPGVETISFAEAANFPLLISHGFRQAIEPWLNAHSIELRYDLLLDSIPIAKEIVQKGRYCSIVPYSMVHAECEKKLLTALTLKEPAILRRLVLANLARKPLSNTVRVIHQLISDHVRRTVTRLTLPNNRTAEELSHPVNPNQPARN